MDAMGFEGCEESSQCREWEAGVEDAVIYWTSAGDTDETVVTGGGKGRSLRPSLTADGTQSQDCRSVHLAALA